MWFSLKENHTSRLLPDHSNCENALEVRCRRANDRWMPRRRWFSREPRTCLSPPATVTDECLGTLKSFFYAIGGGVLHAFTLFPLHRGRFVLQSSAFDSLKGASQIPLRGSGRITMRNFRGLLRLSREGMQAGRSSTKRAGEGRKASPLVPVVDTLKAR